MVDFNGDGHIDIGEAAGTLGFALYLQRQAAQSRNRKVAAMSDFDRACYFANEWLCNRCTQHFGMRRREVNAVAKFMTHMSQTYNMEPDQACQWWLDSGERYWFQEGGRRKWYK